MEDKQMIETTEARTQELKKQAEISRINDIFDRAEVRPDPKIEVVTRLYDGSWRVLNIPDDPDSPVDLTDRLLVDQENIFMALLIRYSNKQVAIRQGDGAAEATPWGSLLDVFKRDCSGFTDRVDNLRTKQPVKVIWEERTMTRHGREIITNFQFTASDDPRKLEEPKFVIEKSVKEVTVGSSGGNGKLNNRKFNVLGDDKD